MARFVESERGENKLIDERNYIYTYSKSTRNGENDIWVCEKRGTCKGRVWTLTGEPNIVKIVTDHVDHAPTAARPQMLQLVQEIRTRARTTQEQPQQILAAAVENIHQNVSALLPRKDNLKRSMRNQRVNQGMPVLPDTLEAMVLPQVINCICIL